MAKNDGNYLGPIIKSIQESIEKFMGNIPSIQKNIFKAVELEIKNLETTSDGTIKTTVKNLTIAARIKSKLTEILLTPEYKGAVKEFLKNYKKLEKLQQKYFFALSKKMKPKPLFREITQQAITDTAKRLTESGIVAGMETQIEAILQNNLTGRVKYNDLVKQFRNSITGDDGILNRYARQIVTDSVNQFTAQYQQVVSSDLGLTWYSYDGEDIKTTRPFCDAMTDFRYFHVSQIPDLLKAVDLYYYNKKTKQREKVPIYKKTGLPHGQYEDTTPENFIIRRGGYTCGHIIMSVSERLVKRFAPEIYNKVITSQAYINWESGQGAPLVKKAKATAQAAPVKSQEELFYEEQKKLTEQAVKKAKENKAPDPRSQGQPKPVRFKEVDAAIKAAYDFLNAINSDQRRVYSQSISTYTGSTYTDMNDHLRYGNDLEDHLKKEIKELTDFLSKAPKYTNTTFRGLKFRDTPRAQAAFKTLSDGLQPGGIFSDKAFMSTSWKEDSAKSFSGSYDSYDTIFLTVEGNSGVAIEKVGGLSMEFEVLFPPNVPFDIISRTERTSSNGKKHISVTIREIE